MFDGEVQNARADPVMNTSERKHQFLFCSVFQQSDPLSKGVGLYGQKIRGRPPMDDPPERKKLSFQEKMNFFHDKGGSSMSWTTPFQPKIHEQTEPFG